VYGDLKLENVMVDLTQPLDHQIKVTDFGFGHVIGTCTDPRGQTSGYVSPDRLKYQHLYTMQPSDDLWTLGLMCAFLLAWDVKRHDTDKHDKPLPSVQFDPDVQVKDILKDMARHRQSPEFQDAVFVQDVQTFLHLCFDQRQHMTMCNDMAKQLEQCGLMSTKWTTACSL
jgi:serine/threonine protein kinase